MFSLSVVIGSASLALLFTSEEKANAAYSNIQSMAIGQPFEIADDFGHRIYMTQKPAAAVLEDMNKSALAHQERALHEAKIRANIQKAAQTNPGLREAFRPPTPGILPMMGGGMPR